MASSEAAVGGRGSRG